MCGMSGEERRGGCSNSKVVWLCGNQKVEKLVMHEELVLLTEMCVFVLQNFVYSSKQTAVENEGADYSHCLCVLSNAGADVAVFFSDEDACEVDLA